MRFVEASFAAEKFGSRYSGSQTKPTRAARSIFAQEPSAQPLQEFAAQWTLNMHILDPAWKRGHHGRTRLSQPLIYLCAPNLQEMALKALQRDYSAV